MSRRARRMYPRTSPTPQHLRTLRARIAFTHDLSSCPDNGCRRGDDSGGFRPLRFQRLPTNNRDGSIPLFCQTGGRAMAAFASFAEAEARAAAKVLDGTWVEAFP